jgi:hypothetical protein
VGPGAQPAIPVEAAVLMLVRISSAGTVGTSNSGSATGGTANTRGCKRTEIPARAPLLTCSDRVAWLWCLLPPKHLLDPLDNKLHFAGLSRRGFLCSELFFGI